MVRGSRLDVGAPVPGAGGVVGLAAAEGACRSLGDSVAAAVVCGSSVSAVVVAVGDNTTVGKNVRAGAFAVRAGESPGNGTHAVVGGGGGVIGVEITVAGGSPGAAEAAGVEGGGGVVSVVGTGDDATSG